MTISIFLSIDRLIQSGHYSRSAGTGNVSLRLGGRLKLAPLVPPFTALCVLHRLASGTTVFLFLILLMACAIPFAAAEKLDSDLIPPEVTLSGANRPSAAAPSVPGLSNNENSNGASDQAATGKPSPPTRAAITASSGPAIPPIDPNKADPVAVIETDKGNITIRLFRKLAPRTVTSFIDIVNTGFYNGLSFHRVEPGFCIQGGDPSGDGSGVYFEPGGQQVRLLALEVNPSLKHNDAGVVAMAHFPKSQDTASCQFYITLAPQPRLDGQYSIFGGVINGMDVVNQIAIGDKIKRITIQEQ